MFIFIRQISVCVFTGLNFQKYEQMIINWTKDAHPNQWKYPPFYQSEILVSWFSNNKDKRKKLSERTIRIEYDRKFILNR